MSKSCLNCENCFQRDEGYSNYTVENTSVYCIIDKHPQGPFDRWYGEEPKLKYAEQCEHFSEGQSGMLDVDEEAWGELDQRFRDFAKENRLVWSGRE